MSDVVHSVFVSYDEAQRMIPIFSWYTKNGQWKDIRNDASKILMELRKVRDIDYSPLPGYQILMQERCIDFLNDVKHQA